MNVYAQINDAKVVEIIPPYVNESGEAVPIEQRYTPEFVQTLVDITDVNPRPLEGWTYDGSVFAAPVPYVPTAAEIIERNTQQRASLMNGAAQSMSPVMVSLQLGNATEEEVAIAKDWQGYYRALKEVDVSLAEPDWPEAPPHI
ncbi:tail fiber assembly protein [Pseudomonas fragi]|uniref:Tail fiber assembly protein n=1 Tax=Pseudomonas fragi TaxID=296 RepID=A0A9Q5B501_PSEFR|nr:tail fiber assembly protein [Pseudomonas fragi]NNB51701.1 tail fiber assembly protein [Pseudomonas fragi]